MRRTRSAPAPFPEADPSPVLQSAIEDIAEPGSIRAVDGRPQIVQFHEDGRAWLARGLPSDQTPGLVTTRHEFLVQPVIADTGIAPIPHSHRSNGTTADGLYEVVSHLFGNPWMNNGRMMLDGHSLHRPLPAPPGGLAALTKLIARFHLASEQSRAGLLPRFTVRDYQRIQRERWQTIRDNIDRSRVREVHIGRWASASQRVVFASWDVLEAAGFLDERALVANHGDLWPSHIIDDGGTIRIVDWRTAHFGSPLIDISQLIARFDGWSGAALEEVIESYLSVRQISADERRLLPVFGALDLAIETGNVLAEAYIADIDQTSQYAEAARSGAGQMLSSLESIGWSIRKTNMDSKELRREAKENARAMREPGRKPMPKRQVSKRPKQ